MGAQTFTEILKFGGETTTGNTPEQTQQYYIMKTDEDKRLIFGWASVAVRIGGEQVLDLQKDLIDPEDLETAVYEYVLDFRDSGEEHIADLRKKGRLVESVVFTKEKMKAMGIPEGTVPEGWWIGFYIDDDEAWEKVKNGTYKMFSIEGQGIREEVDEDTVGKPAVAKSFDEVLKFNPFHDARGRFSNKNGFSSYSANPKTKAGAMAISRSAAGGHGRTLNVHRESKGESIAQNDKWLKTGQKPKTPAAVSRAKYQQRKLKQQQAQQNQTQQTKPQATQTTPPKPKVNYDKRGFADYDAADYHQLGSRKAYYQKQQLTPAEKQAANLYLQSNPQPGSLYSLSQNMNYKMATGQKLTGQYKQVHDNLMGSMHNLGVNAKLTRYDHETMINSLLKSTGAGNDYTKMTGSQLKKALVGKTINENKFLSVSTNDFKNAPSSSKSVFTSRVVKVIYKAKADVKSMMPGNGPGGDLGEIILAPTNGKSNRGGTIVDIRFNGQTARSKGSRSYNKKQVEITIEI